MKSRLTLLIPWALAAGLGWAWFQAEQQQEELRASVTKLTRQQADLRFELKTRTTERDALQRAAEALDQQLGSAKTRTTATEIKHHDLSRNLTAAQQELVERTQRETALLNELARLRQPPERPATASSEVSRATQERIAVLEEQLTALLTRALAEPPARPASPPPRQVLQVGPQDAFVIVDYGAAHGASRGEIIQLQRGTTVLAQAQISDTSPGLSIAQVQPTSVKGQLQTGDLVVFTK